MQLPHWLKHIWICIFKKCGIFSLFTCIIVYLSHVSETPCSLHKCVGFWSKGRVQWILGSVTCIMLVKTPNALTLEIQLQGLGCVSFFPGFCWGGTYDSFWKAHSNVLLLKAKTNGSRRPIDISLPWPAQNLGEQVGPTFSTDNWIDTGWPSQQG